MKFPLSMLRDFVETRLNAEEIGDLLTMAGFELEGIETIEGDDVLDIKVVSNRGDGLSVFGLSREVLAKDPTASPTELYLKAVEGFEMGDESSPGIAAVASVAIESAACDRFSARAFVNAVNSPSPEWLQRRLRQAGQRPLGALVDLTNYVMLELGQPLHAYDLDLLPEPKLIARNTTNDEKLTTLNGVEHTLRPHHLTIASGTQAIGLAGIMGGAETEVGDTTTRVLLEAAHFEANAIRKARKELGLNTDASYRFERSVDPEGTVRALNRFAALLATMQPESQCVPGTLDARTPRPEAPAIEVRVSRAQRLLGMPITVDEARSYLERLGFSVTGTGEPFVVAAPTWRPDIVREVDLVEEIGRVHGFERIPTMPPSGATPIGGLTEFGKAMRLARELALRCGYVQAINHSLRNEHPLDSPNLTKIGPKNPASPEMAWLRSSLWPGLAETALRNGGRDISVFECGSVHGALGDSFVEQRRFAALTIGALTPDHWVKSETPQADFFSLKFFVETVIRAFTSEWEVVPSDKDPRLHPTRQAEARIGEVSVGVFGQIHPQIAEKAGLPPETYLAVLDPEAAFNAGQRHIRVSALSRNPAVRRDISLLIDKKVSYAAIEQAAREAGGADLERVWLSDVYEGKGVPEGAHSLTISLQLRKMGANFTDEAANQARDLIVAALVKLGGSQR